MRQPSSTSSSPFATLAPGAFTESSAVLRASASFTRAIAVFSAVVASFFALMLQSSLSAMAARGNAATSAITMRFMDPPSETLFRAFWRGREARKFRGAAALMGGDEGQQPCALAPHDFIALARHRFELGAVEHLDVPAPIADDAGFLQLARGLGDPLAP